MGSPACQLQAGRAGRGENGVASASVTQALPAGPSVILCPIHGAAHRPPWLPSLGPQCCPYQPREPPALPLPTPALTWAQRAFAKSSLAVDMCVHGCQDPPYLSRPDAHPLQWGCRLRTPTGQGRPGRGCVGGRCKPGTKKGSWREDGVGVLGERRGLGALKPGVNSQLRCP